MKVNYIQLLHDYNIPYQTSGHKHCRKGWANMPCPFCSGNPGLHLGLNIKYSYWYCWRCGHKKADAVIAKLLNVSINQARDIIKKYATIVTFDNIVEKETENKEPFKLPTNLLPLDKEHSPYHVKYLLKRNFDPNKLVKEWSLQATGPTSMLNELKFSNRIFIPIYWNGELVSYQARSINPKNEMRYLFCPKSMELINPKDILYGNPEYWSDIGICVEGVTDVWRLGPCAFATFGVNYSRKQLKLMTMLFKKIYVLYDDDKAGLEAGYKLVNELNTYGVETERIHIGGGDPADLSQEEADKLVKNLLENNT